MIRYSGFGQMLREQAQFHPDAPAILYEESDSLHTLSYKGLYQEVLARSKKWSSAKKTCLGILCDGSLECILTIFASVLSGMQIVLLDDTAPEQLLREQITYTDIDVLWGDPELTAELETALTGGLSTPPRGHIIFFTSGTTDQVKGVVLTDQSLMNSAYNGSCMLPLQSDDRLLCLLPLNHVFGFVCSLLWGLSCGAQVALGRGVRHHLDDLKFFAPTVISVVPLLLSFLIRQNALNDELKQILVGAGDCPRELLMAVTYRGIRVSYGYGLTETSSGVAISTSGDPYAMEICPDDHIMIAPDGEILVHAPTCIMQGYYKRPEDTAAVLKNGILYTGDLGLIDEDGKLYLIGRKKEMLVLADGTKIFLPEYESQIQKALPEREFAVVEKDHVPILVIHGDPSDKAEIQVLLRPVMALRPRGQQLTDITFVKDPLPRTASGKVKRWELQQMLEKIERNLPKFSL